MDIIDFDSCKQNLRVYGGSAGHKLGIVFNDINYLLKFPGNLKGLDMKNVNLSYSNSPLCEYLGSHIYEILGIPSHKTLLGKRSGKIVTACEDFCSNTDKLYEFGQIKVTFEPHFVDSTGNFSNGNGTDLVEVLKTIEEHPLLKDIKSVKERFWDMFVIDALIGNSDRNNGNWGIIMHQNETRELAPVYDNGNCLNNKWDLQKINTVLENKEQMENEIYRGKICIFTLNNHRINPANLIQSQKYPDCNKAIKRIVPKLNQNQTSIEKLINDIPERFENLEIISSTQKKFFTTIIAERYNKILLPTYKKITEQTQSKPKSSADDYEGIGM